VVFPIEAEPRAKRRALNLCQEHLRKVIEVVRKTVQIIDAFSTDDSDSVIRLYDEVQKISDEIADSKRAVTQELIEVGAILLNREDFLRFTFIASEISELCKGVAFRILTIVERKWDIPPDIKKGIAELSSATFNAMMRLRDTVFALGYGSPQVSEKAKEVELSEREVDNLYRKLEILVLERNMEMSKTLLTRDVIRLLEDTADKIEDASDATRILALVL
jgi:predicted phosphate transport protein (TIGR00153 family)